ncbi:TetR/AcrR family transcriptional regulator [Streptomyces sp. 8L]|uniref:TetR/AcrR family transcriptional regulator n=1 Tax=Streptomyces sp. 8L TaxID=2877242 RepID=UPI001CD220D5|nr:TetR/AcrR family transcriptional regulator [Streptomyces sp. 8L]MCA1224087.1 TetR/AcrR family transcriptional regulator [Streptomyces sp. 8L]
MTATAELFRRHGYTGTGLKQIVAAAGAPFGSVYHFFPGGKAQLGEEVVRRSGAEFRDLVLTVLDHSPDLVTGVGMVFTGAAHTLVATGYEDACPIETVALEVASTNEPLRVATADVFGDWLTAGTGRFTRHGLPEDTARALVTSMICSLEGAFVLSRALRDPEPVLTAGAVVVEAVRRALAEAGDRQDR